VRVRGHAVPTTAVSGVHTRLAVVELPIFRAREAQSPNAETPPSDPHPAASVPPSPQSDGDEGRMLVCAFTVRWNQTPLGNA
jgi:hypothetical protein